MTLDLVPTDELVAELQRRFRTCAILTEAPNKIGPNGQMRYWTQGDSLAILGMLAVNHKALLDVLIGAAVDDHDLESEDAES